MTTPEHRTEERRVLVLKCVKCRELHTVEVPVMPTPEASGEGADSAWEAQMLSEAMQDGLVSRDPEMHMRQMRGTLDGLHRRGAAIRATVTAGEDADDDAWSSGYDEGFAASKRLCDALERAALSPRETPVAGLDVERLGDAFATVVPVPFMGQTRRQVAARIAAEYARPVVRAAVNGPDGKPIQPHDRPRDFCKCGHHHIYHWDDADGCVEDGCRCKRFRLAAVTPEPGGTE